MVYHRNQNTINYLVAAFTQLSQTVNYSPKSKLHICTIPPISIKTYNNHLIRTHRQHRPQYTYQYQIQQEQLEADIRYINTQIYSINSSHDHHTSICTFSFHSDLTHTVKRHSSNGEPQKLLRQFSYNKLYDGIHPSDELAAKWHTCLYKKLSYEPIFYTPLAPDSSSEDESGESWDFKRHKVTYK